VEKEYRVECEECDALTIVLVEGDREPEFCPMCGRRAEAEDISETDI
jgi:rubrerythrin|tara:strand:+ start:4162 stop:4302 length:141 start_codon:yes stop_codon:yes gene_type:complete